MLMKSEADYNCFCNTERRKKKTDSVYCTSTHYLDVSRNYVNLTTVYTTTRLLAII